ncbi:MAG: hypothetical protein WDM89_10360 [Rhizomicrobium sp.]
MRWAALGVDFEMFGKDHQPNQGLYDRICRIAGGEPPEHFVFELFLDEHGQKISKSKGNGITIEEWLTYGPEESIALFMFQKPRTAKKLHFDQIPKAVDDYIALLAQYRETNDPTARIENPVWHIHNGNPPDEVYPVSFALLLTLVSASNANDRNLLWGFIRAYAPEAHPDSNPGLDRLVGYALRYYEDFVKPTKQYRAPTDKERAALGRTRRCSGGIRQGARFRKGAVRDLRDRQAPCLRSAARLVQGDLRSRAWPDTRPRFGSFAALYGCKETAAMIRAALVS